MNWGETKVFTWGELSSLTWGEIALDKFELLKSLAKKPDTPDEVLTKLADLCDSFVESYIQLDISKKYPVKYIPSHQSDRLSKEKKILLVITTLAIPLLTLINDFYGNMKDSGNIQNTTINNYNIQIQEQDVHELTPLINEFLTNSKEEINNLPSEESKNQEN